MPRIFKIFFFTVFLLTLVLFTNSRLMAASGGGLISHTQAESHGLTRAWFSQVRLDPGQGRVSHVTLAEKSDNHPDTLFVQTDRAGLHVIDAETGQTLWVKKAGRSTQPSLPLGFNEEVVAVVNGTKLYILKRGKRQNTVDRTGQRSARGRSRRKQTSGFCAHG